MSLEPRLQQMLHELADLGVEHFTPQARANDGAATTPAQALVPAAATDSAAASSMPNPAAMPGVSGLRAVAIAYEEPTIISVEHRRRLLDGELYAASSRLEWALLLRRTQGIDALRCPACMGRMRAMATLTEPGAVNKILAHLGLPTEPLPRARARDPRGRRAETRALRKAGGDGGGGGRCRHRTRCGGVFSGVASQRRATEVR